MFYMCLIVFVVFSLLWFDVECVCLCLFELICLYNCLFVVDCCVCLQLLFDPYCLMGDSVFVWFSLCSFVWVLF